MKKTAFSVALLALGGLSFSGAQAATIGDSFTNVEQTTEIAQTGSLDTFDSNLGTLTQVDLTINGSVTTTIQLISLAATTESATGITTSVLSFTADNGAALNGTPMSIAISSGLQVLAPGDQYSSGELNDTESALTTYTSAGDLGLFTTNGAGSFAIDCTSESSLNVQGGGGNILGGQSTTAGCGASVEYTYTAAPTPTPTPPPAVPSPAPLLLIGLGLAGLAGTRRRK